MQFCLPAIFNMSIRKSGMRWSQPQHWETSGKQGGMCPLSCLLPKMSKECVHILVKCKMSGSKDSLKIPPEKPGQSWKKCVLSRQFSFTRRDTSDPHEDVDWALSEVGKKSSGDILQGQSSGGSVDAQSQFCLHKKCWMQQNSLWSKGRLVGF